MYTHKSLHTGIFVASSRKPIELLPPKENPPKSYLTHSPYSYISTTELLPPPIFI